MLLMRRFARFHGEAQLVSIEFKDVGELRPHFPDTPGVRTDPDCPGTILAYAVVSAR